jgi:hypothetical protein
LAAGGSLGGVVLGGVVLGGVVLGDVVLVLGSLPVDPPTGVTSTSTQ